ncbi:ImmA/IrrE family metallo-endopeptidase [Aneurinibacillus sp. Ricciae_BoGa-3]|uniref:ImmA/IrrE family metallo-endopeptidase n=1 Tax=Aneurinibacillus sp. Ricciae_BoGa-3 TaxID=3022697 RepID=UPI0023401754|nr:ImmA/IrrE family metallo-endopeptidase [Aneurinibacillus sp. Ricciae_BoGa-3]WCK55385.1 ImmA/IrrE family metallo-endopeptidase [Aneurinibacillus sp. Ricciae_BoGa-3]
MNLSQLLPKKPISYWEERANKVLLHFNFKHPDEIDIEEICYRYGVKIMPLDEIFCPEMVDKPLNAFSIPSTKGRRGIIFIRPGLNPIDKKILLAEEFCHIYAHHVSELLADKILLDKTEQQAKRMSAYLLMPRQFMKIMYDEMPAEGLAIEEIADIFLVTEEFAQYRLELDFDQKAISVISRWRGQYGSIEWID